MTGFPQPATWCGELRYQRLADERKLGCLPTVCTPTALVMLAIEDASTIGHSCFEQVRTLDVRDLWRVKRYYPFGPWL